MASLQVLGGKQKFASSNIEGTIVGLSVGQLYPSFTLLFIQSSLLCMALAYSDYEVCTRRLYIVYFLSYSSKQLPLYVLQSFK